jgi:peptide/nickel transport system ATP-binding protein
MSSEAVRQRSAEVLNLVGIDAAHLRSYPHQLSGGMRQRAMIAMALIFTPQLVIMDEPTSALDVVAQRSLMNQIRELQQRLGFAVIFVTHDMSVVSLYSDRVMVMYAGQIVEEAVTRSIFAQPLHPYTKGLISAFPSARGPRRALTGIAGNPPNLADPPAGCRFNPRCPDAFAACGEREPELLPVDNAYVRCLLFEPRHGDELGPGP